MARDLQPGQHVVLHHPVDGHRMNGTVTSAELRRGKVHVAVVSRAPAIAT